MQLRKEIVQLCVQRASAAWYSCWQKSQICQKSSFASRHSPSLWKPEIEYISAVLYSTVSNFHCHTFNVTRSGWVQGSKCNARCPRSVFNVRVRSTEAQLKMDSLIQRREVSYILQTWFILEEIHALSWTHAVDTNLRAPLLEMRAHHRKQCHASSVFSLLSL